MQWTHATNPRTLMGYRDPNDWQEQLQASLRRAQEAIARGSSQQDQMVREWTENLRNAYPDWGRERGQRRPERKLRRPPGPEAKGANPNPFEGDPCRPGGTAP